MSKRKKPSKTNEPQPLNPGAATYRFHIIYWNGEKFEEDDVSAVNEKAIFDHLAKNSSCFKIEQKERIR